MQKGSAICGPYMHDTLAFVSFTCACSVLEIATRLINCASDVKWDYRIQNVAFCLTGFESRWNMVAGAKYLEFACFGGLRQLSC